MSVVTEMVSAMVSALTKTGGSSESLISEVTGTAASAGMIAGVLSSVTYPRERPYYVELSPEKTLPYELETIEIDTCYNKIFTPEMVAGHWQMASQSLNSVILSQSMAIKTFGNAESAIGKHMTLMRRLNTSPESTPKTGGIVYTIQAVMKDIPLNNSLDFMQNIDMLTVNDSEGLLQSSKRHNMTGAKSFKRTADESAIFYGSRTICFR